MEATTDRLRLSNALKKGEGNDVHLIDRSNGSHAASSYYCAYCS